MRIFDETKTRELESYNKEDGYLIPDKLVIHHDEIPEKVLKSSKEIAEELEKDGKEVNLRADGNYYVVTNIAYKDGVRWGNDEDLIEPIIEKGKEAWDEEEQIFIYTPYTEKQKAENKISELKQKLFESDYKAIKYAEGYLSEDEYAPIKNERQSWRDKINELEEKLKNIEE